MGSTTVRISLEWVSVAMSVSCYLESSHVLRFRNLMSAFTLSWNPISREVAMSHFHQRIHKFHAHVRMWEMQFDV
jgi:hypothetical protein